MSKNLKKKIGSEPYNYLIRNYNTDFLSETLPQVFGLLSDIRHLKDADFPRLKIILNDFLKEEEKGKEIKPTKTAKELLDEAGFILDDNIQNKNDYTKYEQFFDDDEKLCKFHSYDATKRYKKVFFILRKNYENIKRLENPKRQDDYSTSIMSVGISDQGDNVAQITSRYNHTVAGGDNTYNSNLENIVVGLTEAFNQDYNLNLGQNAKIELENFYFTNNKYWFYHYEINGCKYGNNTIDGVYYHPDNFFIFENYILDLKNKSIRTADDTQDAFVDIVNEKLKKGAKIQIQKDDGQEHADREDLILILI